VLQLVIGEDGARSVVDFDVHRYAGCYFVSFWTGGCASRAFPRSSAGV